MTLSLFVDFMIFDFAHDVLLSLASRSAEETLLLRIESESRNIAKVISLIIFLIENILARFIFLFFMIIIFQSFKILFSVSIASTFETLTTRFRFDFFTRCSLILFARALSVFFFFFILILHFETQAICLFSSQIAHLLNCSIIIELYSLIRCSFAHRSHAMKTRQHFFM